MTQERAVIVKQLPELLFDRQRSTFFNEVKGCLDVNRPCLVLDCSRLTQIDTKTIHLLLCCLEEAMKRNGDARLAEVSPKVRAAMKIAGADALFRFFATSAEAIRSFDRHANGFGPRDYEATDLLRDTKSVARSST